jgi:hypothetical protein
MVLSVLIAGCGRSGHIPAEAYFAALARRWCGSLDSPVAVGPPTVARHRREAATIRALAVADKKLPRIRTLISSLAARGRVRAAMERKEGERKAIPFALREESYLLTIKVHNAWHAIGVTDCETPYP